MRRKNFNCSVRKSESKQTKTKQACACRPAKIDGYFLSSFFTSNLFFLTGGQKLPMVHNSFQVFFSVLSSPLHATFFTQVFYFFLYFQSSPSPVLLADLFTLRYRCDTDVHIQESFRRPLSTLSIAHLFQIWPNFVQIFL